MEGHFRDRREYVPVGSGRAIPGAHGPESALPSKPPPRRRRPFMNNARALDHAVSATATDVFIQRLRSSSATGKASVHDRTRRIPGSTACRALGATRRGTCRGMTPTAAGLLFVIHERNAGRRGRTFLCTDAERSSAANADRPNLFAIDSANSCRVPCGCCAARSVTHAGRRTCRCTRSVAAGLFFVIHERHAVSAKACAWRPFRDRARQGWRARSLQGCIHSGPERAVMRKPSPPPPSNVHE